MTLRFLARTQGRRASPFTLTGSCAGGAFRNRFSFMASLAALGVPLWTSPDPCLLNSAASSFSIPGPQQVPNTCLSDERRNGQSCRAP